MSDSIVIVDAKRSPVGAMLGNLSPLQATEVGAQVIKALVPETCKKLIDQVIMGCVLPAGLGQAPARQAALHAGLSHQASAITLNKVCGSGLQAVMTASDNLRLGFVDMVVAGGMESMSNAPYLLSKARAGMRMGHQMIYDHMFLDGLENAYDGKSMGYFAQQTANELAITRQQMDEFALYSLEKAQHAQIQGHFTSQIVPIAIQQGNDTVVVFEDEAPKSARREKIPQLRPAFAKDGTITAANSSSISDGAAALLLMRESTAKVRYIKAMAKIVGHATHAQAPESFATAPIGAIKQLMTSLNWSVDDVDLFEINEAFAMVTMATMNALQIPSAKVNIHGGACALGHPIGASGARILVTLCHALMMNKGNRGIAALCIGGGEAVAVAVEKI
jgi:acetyl-CoA C-acetyltransferase